MLLQGAPGTSQDTQVISGSHSRVSDLPLLVFTVYGRFWQGIPNCGPCYSFCLGCGQQARWSRWWLESGGSLRGGASWKVLGDWPRGGCSVPVPNPLLLLPLPSLLLPARWPLPALTRGPKWQPFPTLPSGLGTPNLSQKTLFLFMNQLQGIGICYSLST